MKQSLILINWTPEGTLTAAMFVKLCGLVKISADITVKSGTLRSQLNIMPANNLQNMHCDRAVQDRGRQFKSKTDAKVGRGLFSSCLPQWITREKRLLLPEKEAQ